MEKAVRAGLLNAYRFIADSRDQATEERLDDLNDANRVFRCRFFFRLYREIPILISTQGMIDYRKISLSGLAGERKNLIRS